MNYSPSQKQFPLKSIENIPIPSTNVYVCFLPQDMTEDLLIKIFEKFGKILSFKLLKRKDGFTYSHISYETIVQAQLAIKNMDKFKMQDKKLKVNFASQVSKTKNKKVEQNLKKIENEKEVKIFTELLIQKIPSKREKKRSKKEKKKQTKIQTNEEKNIKKEVKQTSKSSKKNTKIVPEKQQKIVQIKADKEIQNQPRYEKKFLDDQEITEIQWSQDFDPSDLKKKPFSTFVL